MTRALLCFAIAFAAALAGSMSGGSASALTTPAWLALGVPLPLAVATDKLQGALWTLLGARNYLRRRAVDRALLAGMIPLGVAGAWLGARVTASLDPGRLEPAVGAAILALMAVMLLRPRLGREARPPRLARGAVTATALPLGLYEGILGSGNSLLASLLFCGGRGMDLPTALGHYYVLAFAWCAVAAASYARLGFFDAALAIPAVLGGCAGGYLGSRVASARGAGFVRGAFLVAGTLLGAGLLLGGLG